MRRILYIIIGILCISIIGIGGNFGKNIVSKLHYTSFISKNTKEKIERSENKDIKLQKEVIFFVKNLKYRKNYNINLYKDYFIINGDYCDIKDTFFTILDEDLKGDSIIFKPKIDFTNMTGSELAYKSIGKKINKDNLKHNICTFINSQKSTDYLEIELQNYMYSDEEVLGMKKLIPIGSYHINKYYKIATGSILNSQNLIDKLSYEFIYSGENISVLKTLLNKTGSGLLFSNVLKNGKIIQDIGGGSCLASTIIYRTLLDAGITIKSQKTHNIYYENIYGTGEIGLDSTIYEDENFFVDLLFENNYKNPIIFIPTYTATGMTLTIYAKEKEYTTILTPIDLKNKENISWKYEVYDKNNKQTSEQNLTSRYDRIDNF